MRSYHRSLVTGHSKPRSLVTGHKKNALVSQVNGHRSLKKCARITDHRSLVTKKNALVSQVTGHWSQKKMHSYHRSLVTGHKKKCARITGHWSQVTKVSQVTQESEDTPRLYLEYFCHLVDGVDREIKRPYCVRVYGSCGAVVVEI